MKLLALDIGLRRTGVAFFESDVGIPLPLQTIDAADAATMITSVRRIVLERSIDRLVVGLPLLLSGVHGEQAQYVEALLPSLRELCQDVVLIDERYTTPPSMTVDRKQLDLDGAAACNLLRIHLNI